MTMPNPKKINLTLRAVDQQLTAMAEKRYDLGVRDAKQQIMRNFSDLTKDEVLHRIDFLKAENAKGKHIYIRPSQTGLVLVDDVSQATLDRMVRERVRPALVVETSPQNYQAWIRLSFEPIHPDIATMASKILAKRYSGDIASADFKHYGRLAGFTNTKPEYINALGQYPFVKIGARSGKLAERANEILNAAQRDIQIALQRLSTPFVSLDGLAHQDEDISRATSEYGSLRAPIELKYSPNVNYSKLDWMVSKQMLLGGFSENAVRAALIECSPNLVERKGKYVEDYAERTARNAREALENASASPLTI